MGDITDFVLDQLEADAAVVRAVIIASSGSTPRKTGSRMAIAQSGACQGSVGGGPAEAIVQRTAPEVLQSKSSLMLNLDFTARDAASAGMICGGRMQILLQCIAPQPGNRELWQTLSRCQANRQPCTLISALEAPQDSPALKTPLRIIYQGLQPRDLPGSIPGSFQSEIARQAEMANVPCVLEHSALTVLLEPMSWPGRVVIAGAGHVGAATASLAAQTGFQTIVLDDRPEFVPAERLPRNDQRLLIDDFSACLDGLNLAQEDFVLILTRGHLQDKTVLAQALQTKAGYIGMIGSRTKREATYNALLQQGFTQADLDRVTCPIGLDIGAQTPEEIAVSIIAQLIAHRAGSKSRSNENNNP